MMEETSILNEEHIFIHSLLGRTGSTAIQRLLNSSGEITIWGEPWGLIARVLDFSNFLEMRKTKLRGSHQQQQFQVLVECMKSGVHDKFYPNAFRPLDDSIDLVDQLLINLLKSPDQTLTKFGYKDITNFKSSFIENLTKKFPNAHIVFMIRKPAAQWQSIKSTGFFNFDLDFFVNTYYSIGATILDLKQKFPNFPIIEKEWLMNDAVVSKLFESLSISKHDSQLVGRTVSTYPSARLEKSEYKKIQDSGVVQIYNQLKDYSSQDYSRIMS